MHRHNLDNGNGTEDTDKCPEDGHQVTRRDGLRLAISEEVRNGVRKVSPWRRRYQRVQEAVNVEIPQLVRHDDGL